MGGISKIRGIYEIVEACSLTKHNVKLNLAGPISESLDDQALRTKHSWCNVRELGMLDRAGVRDVLSKSLAGLVTLHPIPNYKDALPIKMFEYMSAGIPVIASDFPYWREIVEGHNCGVCVDPLDSQQIAEAIDHFVDNKDLAEKMGENGRHAVLTKYNWSNEEQRLIDFYSKIAGN